MECGRTGYTPLGQLYSLKVKISRPRFGKKRIIVRRTAGCTDDAPTTMYQHVHTYTAVALTTIPKPGDTVNYIQTLVHDRRARSYQASVCEVGKREVAEYGHQDFAGEVK